MRLLDRYLLRELLVPFGYCLSGFLIFWISADLLTSLDEFSKYQLTGLEILEYYLVKAPADLVFVLPIALLLALLYTLTNLARHHEITAIRAAGISLWRLALPYVGVGVLLSVGSFSVSEFWIPRSVEISEQILTRHAPIPRSDATPQWERKLGFTNLRDNREWLIEAYNVATSEMIRPHVRWSLADGGWKVLSADNATLVGGVWVFTNAQLFSYSRVPGEYPRKEEFEILAMPDFSESPEEIRSEIKVGRINVINLKAARKAQLSIQEILDYKRLHPSGSIRLAMLDTKLQGLLAAPWTCLVVVLIALPFGATTGRRNVFVGVASSIIICFAFFILRELTLALGTGGFVPAWVAGWAPNMTFAALGIWLTWRVR